MRFSLATAMLFTLLTAVGLQAQGGVKIAYIDSNVIREAPVVRQAQQRLEREIAEYQIEMEQMQTDYDEAVQGYQAQQLTMSAEARAQREQQLGAMGAQYDQRAAEIRNLLAAKEAEVMGPVIERVNEVISQIREEGAYSIIFDVAGSDAVVAVDETLDLSDEVMRRLAESADSGGL